MTCSATQKGRDNEDDKELIKMLTKLASEACGI
jgi:hypothetical protein